MARGTRRRAVKAVAKKEPKNGARVWIQSGCKYLCAYETPHGAYVYTVSDHTYAEEGTDPRLKVFDYPIPIGKEVWAMSDHIPKPVAEGYSVTWSFDVSNGIKFHLYYDGQREGSVSTRSMKDYEEWGNTRVMYTSTSKFYDEYPLDIETQGHFLEAVFMS